MRYYGKIHSKLPIFRVKSVKFTPAKKNLHEPRSWARDKYQVCLSATVNLTRKGKEFQIKKEVKSKKKPLLDKLEELRWQLS